MDKYDVAACWKEVFPNSSAHYQTFLKSTGFAFRLAKDPSEVPNGIMQNDPLGYSARLEADGTWKEDRISMLVHPTIPNMVYGSVNLRKKTIKDVDSTKLIKRFREVRKFILENSDKLKNPMFDISDK